MWAKLFDLCHEDAKLITVTQSRVYGDFTGTKKVMLYSKIFTLNNKPLKEDLPKKFSNVAVYVDQLTTPGEVIDMPLKPREI